mmetsp:Transcript_10831/g.24177  ORF Transcript_10831/g.24177 Transcript_10831/m.24177 type:complete len:88 (-) Transcript_10831:23-286(-)
MGCRVIPDGVCSRSRTWRSCKLPRIHFKLHVQSSFIHSTSFYVHHFMYISPRQYESNAVRPELCQKMQASCKSNPMLLVSFRHLDAN